MATVPSIVDVYPANGSSGIAIGDHITVTFDQEMDEDSINTGTFVLSGPDQGVFFGGELNPFEEPGLTTDDILDSPYFDGFVQCTVSFSRVDASGSPVADTAVDYTGAGTSWRTVAILTPQTPLSPGKQYSVFLAGDEDPTNAFDSGVRTRTVFDPQPIVLTGTGKIYAGGGYTGDSIRTYTVEILTGGTTGNAVYKWWNNSDPLTTYNGITVTGRRELEDGLYITCDPDGTFAIGDKWTIVVVPFYALANTYRWVFTTGSGAILTPPSLSSSSGIESLIVSGAGDLRVVSIEPADNATNLDPDAVSVITITFNQAIDESTITDETVVIKSEPVDGLLNGPIQYTGVIAKVLSVSGNTLTIQIS